MITSQKIKIVSEINDKVSANAKNISCILEENKLLKKENEDLKDRIGRIEQTQLSNNALITGIPEQTLEPYATTKQRILDTLTAAISNAKSISQESAIEEATAIEISYCTRLGKY